MISKITFRSAILMSLCVAACSNDTEKQPQEHVFKGYENALEKAKQVQPQMEEAEEKRRKQLEDMMR